MSRAVHPRATIGGLPASRGAFFTHLPMTQLIRPMCESDLPGVLAVQAACHPVSMQEPAEVVLARLRAAPASCLVAQDALEPGGSGNRVLRRRGRP